MYPGPGVYTRDPASARTFTVNQQTTKVCRHIMRPSAQISATQAPALRYSNAERSPFELQIGTPQFLPRHETSAQKFSLLYVFFSF